MSKDIAEKIGEKIRNTRKDKNMTLKELAAISNVSTSMISKIEKAQTLPPISTYANIATGLGISIGDLFQDDMEDPDISIVRAGDKKVISRGPYVGSVLAYPKKRKLMEPFLFEYPYMKNPPDFTHNNEEILFILEGALEFKYGDEVFVLDEGDCAYINGKIPHRGRAVGNKTTRVLVVQSTI